MTKRIVIYSHNEDMASLKPLAKRLEKKGAEVRFATLKFPEVVKADQVLVAEAHFDAVTKLYEGNSAKVTAISAEELEASKKEAAADAASPGLVTDYNGEDVEDPAKAHDQKSVRDSDENAKDMLTADQERAKRDGKANLIDAIRDTPEERDEVIIGGAKKGTAGPETVGPEFLEAQVVPPQFVRRGDVDAVKKAAGPFIKSQEEVAQAIEEAQPATELSDKAVAEINADSKTALDMHEQDRLEVLNPTEELKEEVANTPLNKRDTDPVGTAKPAEVKAAAVDKKTTPRK